MRKNATSLMETGYKKAEFLVEGMRKAQEMNHLRDKLQMEQTIETNKNTLNKMVQDNKSELYEIMNSKTN